MTVKQPEIKVQESCDQIASQFVVWIDDSPRFYASRIEEARAFVDGYEDCFNSHFGRE